MATGGINEGAKLRAAEKRLQDQHDLSSALSSVLRYCSKLEKELEEELAVLQKLRSPNGTDSHDFEDSLPLHRKTIATGLEEFDSLYQETVEQATQLQQQRTQLHQRSVARCLRRYTKKSIEKFGISATEKHAKQTTAPFSSRLLQLKSWVTELQNESLANQWVATNEAMKESEEQRCDSNLASVAEGSIDTPGITTSPSENPQIIKTILAPDRVAMDVTSLNIPQSQDAPIERFTLKFRTRRCETTVSIAISIVGSSEVIAETDLVLGPQFAVTVQENLDDGKSAVDFVTTAVWAALDSWDLPEKTTDD
eukprot:m.329204 g.329204  ORF g.329204 m.329204 type:complete len:310 (-) comp20442_c0_seq4:1490-2419(-)